MNTFPPKEVQNMCFGHISPRVLEHFAPYSAKFRPVFCNISPRVLEHFAPKKEPLKSMYSEDISLHALLTHFAPKRTLKNHVFWTHIVLKKNVLSEHISPEHVSVQQRTRQYFDGWRLMEYYYLKTMRWMVGAGRWMVGWLGPPPHLSGRHNHCLLDDISSWVENLIYSPICPTTIEKGRREGGGTKERKGDRKKRKGNGE